MLPAAVACGRDPDELRVVAHLAVMCGAYERPALVTSAELAQACRLRLSQLRRLKARLIAARVIGVVHDPGYRDMLWLRHPARWLERAGHEPHRHSPTLPPRREEQS